MRRALVVLMMLAVAHSARAEDLVAADGTSWRIDGRTLKWGSLEAMFDSNYLGIDCAAGMSTHPKVALPYLPAGYIAYEEVETDRTRLVACADVGNGVVVATVFRHGALTPAEANAVRGLLVTFAEFGASAKQSKFDQLHPFETPATPIALSHETGAWKFFRLHEGRDEFAFFLDWPAATAAFKVTRTRASQQCSTVGLSYGARPAWAPSTFANYGATKGTWESACLDSADGRLILIETDTKTVPADQRPRVTALLEAIVAAVGVASPSPAAPTPSVAEAPTSSTSTPTYTPSYSSSDTGSQHVSLRERLRGLSFALHRLGPSEDAIDTSYGVSLSYARTLRRESTLRPRVLVKGGYDSQSQLLADLRLEIGAHVGEEIAGAEVFGAVGADGVGLGRDAMDAVHIGFDAYYGLGGRLRVGEIDLGFAYLWRNADDIAGARKHFELGYLLGHGERIGLDIDWYNDAGTFIAATLTL